ncbi:FKBP-type peptidyl-prolyl cis-trans isomerase [Salinisphaera sp. Q1T1-3]|uniref:FKBP-type peptidyl-prolyl cis-trans isomerase n=1 Tax=Salinisphaera sp. Q1T1-3 TaxID=2321229 RepID=UPI000E70D2B7|nr:FKBP-type peptidyl-prolyl cis-trans isomerase [Salinisphaera sp. Q1T1-3]
MTSAAAESSVTQLRVIDKKIGDGTKATPGTRVTVDYTGWLYDANAKDHRGKKFDSSRDRGQPLSFELGFGRVIDGWDRGIAGMRVGGERTLIIPPDLAYGAQGSGGSIPPNATLIFDVTLEDVLQ